MGYIIVFVLGLLLLAFVVVALSRSRPVGQVPPRAHDVTVKQPAAAEPTPPRSDTAPGRTADRATRRTPPA